MNKIKILNRKLTSEEIKQMDSGFDELMLEEGLQKESSERLNNVALMGNTFIGCSSGLAYKNGESYSGWFYLTDLFVEKPYRSQGLGEKLLLNIEQQVKTLGVNHIWLWTSGEKALKFYDKLDYKKFAEMENWYSDKSSRIGLRKDL